MVDKNKVEYVAKLARIDIGQEEKEYLSQQLSKIIVYIDKLKEAKTDDVEPMRGLHSQLNVFREDAAKISGFSEKILENSPLREGRYFRIPKVID